MKNQLILEVVSEKIHFEIFFPMSINSNNFYLGVEMKFTNQKKHNEDQIKITSTLTNFNSFPDQEIELLLIHKKTIILIQEHNNNLIQHKKLKLMNMKLQYYLKC